MLSKEEQIENLLVAQAMFADIPKFRVDLSTWASCQLRDAVTAGKNPVHTCGSAACFGGWIALHPHFQKLGVRPMAGSGAPVMNNTIGAYSLSEHLFGNPSMFTVGHWATEDDKTSDREEIFARIEYALNELLES